MITSLRYESAPHGPNDVICLGSDDEELSEGHRARKRRRIVEAGKQYLEGRGHFIQTASLRGPFENGWNNPWAKKRCKIIPETIRRHTATPDHTHLVTARDEPVTAKKRANGDQNVLPGVVPDGEPLPLSRHVRHDEFVKRRRRSSSPPKTSGYPQVPADKIWLRRTNIKAYGDNAKHHLSQTPTPTPKPSRYAKPGPSTGYHSPIGRPTTTEKVSIPPEHEERMIKNPFYPGYYPLDDHLINPRNNHTTGLDPTDKKRDKMGHISLSRHNLIGQDFKTSRDVSSGAAAVGNKVAEIPDQMQPKPEATGEISNRIKETSDTTSSISKRTLARKKANKDYVNAAVRQPQTHSARAAPPSTYQQGFEYRAPHKTLPTSTEIVSPITAEPEHVSISSGSSSAFSDTDSSAINGDLMRQREAGDFPLAAISAGSKLKARRGSVAARRLTFTPNGGPRLRESRLASRSGLAHLPNATLFSIQANENAERRESHDQTKVSAIRTSSKVSEKSHSGEKSKESSDILPEAQVVQDPLPPIQAVSGPSTDMLETDKLSSNQPIWDEEDSYADLATQAAMEKARRKFNDDLMASTKRLSPQKASLLHHPVKTPNCENPGGHPAQKTPITNDSYRMSTQAMMNELSPFAITTVKKRSPDLKRRTNFAKSPIAAKTSSPASRYQLASFPVYSPGMSTSPSVSPSPPFNLSTQPPPNGHAEVGPPFRPSASHKRPEIFHTPPENRPRTFQEPTNGHPESSALPPTLSALPSFTILPNGTSTETPFVQDGQQQPQQFISEESYTTLPDLDFARPLSNTITRTNSKDKPATNLSPNTKHENLDKPLTPGTRDLEATSPFDPGSAGTMADLAGLANGTQLGESFVYEDDAEIEAAVEEAGSFLGDWNVDVEARRVGESARAVGAGVEEGSEGGEVEGDSDGDGDGEEEGEEKADDGPGRQIEDEVIGRENKEE